MFTELKPVTQHQVILSFASESEAREFLVDAKPAQIAVRHQLAGLHQDGAQDVHGLNKKPKKNAVGGGKTERRPLASKAKPTKAKLDWREKIACPECGQMVARGQMKNHTRKAHGQELDLADDDREADESPE